MSFLHPVLYQGSSSNLVCLLVSVVLVCQLVEVFPYCVPTIFVTSSQNDRIFAVSGSNLANADITHIGAGNNINADGLIASAGINNPFGMAVDPKDNSIVFTSRASCLLRKLTWSCTNISSSTITTVAGLANNCGITDGSGTNARFNSPNLLTFTSAGILYVGENGRIRRVDVNR